MTTASTEINNWYETLKNQALERNDQSAVTWSKYKDDLETAKNLLSQIPKKNKHSVMVPVGPKALMPGVIVHTNEFLVNLGETWFAKKTAYQTIELCDRRIKTCKEMLEKLDKERELIVNKSTLPAEQEAFGNEERPEIIEYVTEEENEDWKKQHRIREKEYRQKLAELRNKEKKSIETEEDLWKHLDELELQEELEDELNRLNAESSSEEDVTEEINSPKEENQNLEKDNEQSSESEAQNSAKTKRKVSFVCDLDSSDDEPLWLDIKHSDVIPIQSDPNSEEINSPADIYNRHLKLVNKIPLSVLKNKTNSNISHNLDFIPNYYTENDDDEEEQEEVEQLEHEVTFTPGVRLHDISERPITYQNQNIDNKGKKISKFKMARQKSG